MKIKPQRIGILLVAISFGTAWAVRGQFGHEQGAAWAGGIGGIALILVANRKDWLKKILTTSLASAFGWGAAGIISYGAIAGGYAQSDNFINTYYGLQMLFFIGGLYGIIGGGLVGLSLESTESNNVKWSLLISEMVAGGILVHAFLVDQLGLQMSPPRSDAWAISLGAGLALVWYMGRNHYTSSIRVAIWSAIGGGWGFAFGTFFHLVMNWIGLHFNTWNMAEYSIGFWGGMGMAYGVFSSEWPEKSAMPEKWENLIAALLIFALVPLIIFHESFSYQQFLEKFKNSSSPNGIALASTLSAAVIMLVQLALISVIIRQSKNNFTSKDGLRLFLIYAVSYTILSYISTGLFAGTVLTNSNHHLYVVNLIVFVWLLKKGFPAFFENRANEITAKRWIGFVLLIILLLAAQAFLAPLLHGPTGPSYDRFPI